MDDTLQICALCHRTVSSENDNIDLDSITVCGDCKFLLLEENGTPSRHVPSVNTRTRRTRYDNGSLESIEDMFSHQFSTMVNLARQNQTPVSDMSVSARTTPTGSRRWRRVVSDTESDGFDSVNGDGDGDVVSYGAYVEDDDSDVSVDVHSYLGGGSDDDIDPMHAGLNRWSSDDEWEEVEDGEDAENGENTLGALIARVHIQRSIAYDEQISETEGGIHVRISETRFNPFGNMDNDQETSRYVGNSGDYLDGRSFEELLERLAEADNSRRGAPPASQAFVNNLDLVVVNKSDHNGLMCAICKDSLAVGTVVNQLPCSHIYHPPCIKPWLSSRNTCPLCRFEFPTDDVDYENRKESGSREPVVQETQHELDDNASFEEEGGQEVLNDGCGDGMGGRRWLLMAAPVVSLVGIGLALWLGNPGAIRIAAGSREDRSKRLWGLF